MKEDGWLGTQRRASIGGKGGGGVSISDKIMNNKTACPKHTQVWFLRIGFCEKHDMYVGVFFSLFSSFIDITDIQRVPLRHTSGDLIHNSVS